MVQASQTEQATNSVLKYLVSFVLFYFFTALVADFVSAGFGITPTITFSMAISRTRKKQPESLGLFQSYHGTIIIIVYLCFPQHCFVHFQGPRILKATVAIIIKY